MNKDNFYMDLAIRTSKQSKDPHTKVGACVVKDNRIISLGYNGAPRSFPDNAVPMNRDKSLPLMYQKYPYMVHAELNAILNYRGSMSDFVDSTVYVTTSPCYECAKALAQVGVKEVVYLNEYHQEIWDISKIILSNCGIKFRKFEE